jgi:hypothetical protein
LVGDGELGPLAFLPRSGEEQNRIGRVK